MLFQEGMNLHPGVEFKKTPHLFLREAAASVSLQGDALGRCTIEILPVADNSHVIYFLL